MGVTVEIKNDSKTPDLPYKHNLEGFGIVTTPKIASKFKVIAEVYCPEDTAYIFYNGKIALTIVKVEV